MSKKILDTQILDTKKFWAIKSGYQNSGNRKLVNKIVWPKKYLGQKKIDPKINLCPEKLWLPKNQVQNICSNLLIWTKVARTNVSWINSQWKLKSLLHVPFLWPKVFLQPKFIFGSKISVGSKRYLGPKIFWTQNFFWTLHFLGPKILWWKMKET